MSNGKILDMPVVKAKKVRKKHKIPEHTLHYKFPEGLTLEDVKAMPPLELSRLVMIASGEGVMHLLAEKIIENKHKLCLDNTGLYEAAE